ncbi:hypothetical protein MmiHf6_05930 [Methanimicrococcus hongohii]|uniref:Uncharacterized protein n=1 Tax=Methanimicrococcus hongohii TaxID=3028295 RepID=A0AA97A1I7_9EURY|nr:hypothetical protein [Methanimicrococcus sp. Hf6]WNY23288.1 hypothetical protein MmiHf6_05930 [Methanimicrococcus sp. Hf6]
MIFVGKNNQQRLHIFVLLTLATAVCFAGVAEGKEITGDFNKPENGFDVGEMEIGKRTEKETEKNGFEENEDEMTEADLTEIDSAEAELKEAESADVYHSQNVYFTEDDKRYVVVYSNNTYVSLTRNDKAENKSEEEVCQFL